MPPADDPSVEEKEAPIRALDEADIAFLKNYGLGPYAAPIKKAEQDVKDILKRVNDIAGIKESDTGLAPPSRWDLVSDKQMMQEEHPLQVARCTKIINPNTDEAKYVINVKQVCSAGRCPPPGPWALPAAALLAAQAHRGSTAASHS
jgi:26S proteasome regulatory subunit T1